MPPAVEGRSPNHWTARELPKGDRFCIEVDDRGDWEHWPDSPLVVIRQPLEK